MQHPRREEPVRALVLERLRRPVAAAREHVPGELDQAAPAEPPERLRAEPRAVARPELGREDAEREVGVRQELRHRRSHPGPSSATFASCDVVRKTLDPSGKSVAVGSSVFRYSSPRASSSSFSSAYAAEPVNSGCQEAKTSWTKPGSVISAVRIAPPSQSFRSSTQTLHPLAREQRAGDERVDPAPDRDRVVAPHRRLTGSPPRGARSPRPAAPRASRGTPRRTSRRRT